jgi:Kef-type K+ transport system membrane component KefB
MLKAAAFIVLAIAFGRLVLNKLLIKIDQTTIAGKFPEIIFIFAMMIAFLYGVIAQIAGLSAIVGAFLAGISFTGVGLNHSKSFKDGAEYLQVIFASVFFISLGILLDIHTLTWGLAVFIVVLTLVASLSKIIGCGLPAKLYGFSWKNSLAVGVGMVPRGEVAMIVALLGLTQNLITNRAYSALVLMSLFTTIITPVIFRNFLFRNGVKTVR